MIETYLVVGDAPERLFTTYQDMIKYVRPDHKEVYCFSERGVLLCRYCISVDSISKAVTLKGCAL